MVLEIDRTRSQHVWGPPPPGQGGGQICRRCGHRRSFVDEWERANGAEHGCAGRNQGHMPTMAEDYDPLETD